MLRVVARLLPPPADAAQVDWKASRVVFRLPLRVGELPPASVLQAAGRV
jgi:hypothetical protein